MLDDNGGKGSQNVSLTGTGTADLTTTVASLVFPSTKFGTRAVKAFSVTNHQTQAVTLSKSFSGTNAADFSVTGGTCTTSLGALSSCSIYVSFAPGVLGSESATLTIGDSPDPLGTHAIVLSTGPTIPATVTPTSLLYGTLMLTDQQIKTVTVANKSPFTLSLSDSIGGVDPADFAILGGCGATLAPKSYCTIAVTFTPTEVGTRGATLTVGIGQDPSSPHNVSLSGTGM